MRVAHLDIPPKYFLTRPFKVTRRYPKPKRAEFSLRLWRDRFHQYELSDAQLQRLQLTDVGMYSIAKPHLAAALVQLLRRLATAEGFDLSSMTAAETNAGLGGFTIPLSFLFKRVLAVEIDPLHCAIIRNNAAVILNSGRDTISGPRSGSGSGSRSRSKNITVLQTNFFDYMQHCLLKTKSGATTTTDFIISDPEWGGHDYKRQPVIRLGLSNVNIAFFVCMLFQHHPRLKIFILLAPYNFDIDQFMELLGGIEVRIQKYGAGKHYFVVISRSSQE